MKFEKVRIIDTRVIWTTAAKISIGKALAVLCVNDYGEIYELRWTMQKELMKRAPRNAIGLMTRHSYR